VGYAPLYPAGHLGWRIPLLGFMPP
jgi:hypothetical protein